MVNGAQILVANPDVAAPQEHGYSREPGFGLPLLLINQTHFIRSNGLVSPMPLSLI